MFMFFIGFGSEFSSKTNEHPLWNAKYDLILKYLRPIGYKTHYWKNKTKPKDLVVHPPTDDSIPLSCDKIVEDTVTIELCNQFECFDVLI